MECTTKHFPFFVEVFNISAENMASSVGYLSSPDVLDPLANPKCSQ